MIKQIIGYNMVNLKLYCETINLQSTSRKEAYFKDYSKKSILCSS